VTLAVSSVCVFPMAKNPLSRNWAEKKPESCKVEGPSNLQLAEGKRQDVKEQIHENRNKIDFPQ